MSRSFDLKKRERLRRHRFGIDTRPNRVTVPTPFLLVEDDDARLTGDTVTLLDQA